MQKLLLKTISLCVAFAFGHASYAEHPHVLKFNTEQTVTATIPKYDKNLNRIGEKTVYLMSFNLSDEQARKILDTPNEVNMAKLKMAGIPASLDLGMNGVPVLNQGVHGCCVTFANTAAVEAILRRGDYISQLCNLELGTYLANQGLWPDGWEGTFGSYVLTQMTQFGIIPKVSEPKLNCGGLARYPVNSNATGGSMTLDQFKLNRVDIMKNIHWNLLIDDFLRFGGDASRPYNPQNLINNIKIALYNSSFAQAPGSRVTIGFLLYPGQGSAGADAKRFATSDTWSLTKGILAQTSAPSAGHEVVITGYDDNAVVTDSDGTTHTGVFIIRNSWGLTAGNQGNYYMTYEYFAKYEMEAQQLLAASVPAKQ